MLENSCKPYITHYSSFHFLFHYPHIAPIEQTVPECCYREDGGATEPFVLHHVGSSLILTHPNNLGVEGTPLMNDAFILYDPYVILEFLSNTNFEKPSVLLR